MKKKKRKGYRTNTFYHYANEYYNALTTTEELEKIDMTEEFWTEIDKVIKEKELLNINVNGQVATGKSTLAMEIARRIQKMYFEKELGIKDIDRDQQEFSKTMRNPNIKNTIRIIDEWNELENTGENVTVERALYDYFSDVMAQRYVHKISCSPNNTADRNAQIYLEVFSTDKQKEITYAKLSYKIGVNGGTEKQLLGHIKINVTETIKSKWYKEYRRRKFEKMNLILKEGIFQPRKLEYATIILNVVNKLRKLARLTSILNPNIVRNYVKMECRNKKIPQSIIGEELAVREVQGILDLWKSYWKLNKETTKKEEEINKEIRKGGADRNKIALIKEQTETNRTIIEELTQAIDVQTKELERYKEIYDKYNTILE